MPIKQLMPYRCLFCHQLYKNRSKYFFLFLQFKTVFHNTFYVVSKKCFFLFLYIFFSHLTESQECSCYWLIKIRFLLWYDTSLHQDLIFNLIVFFQYCSGGSWGNLPWRCPNIFTQKSIVLSKRDWLETRTWLFVQWRLGL